jgi:anti-sigma regulatory factor (Ser/Thr protein kinase)
VVAEKRRFANEAAELRDVSAWIRAYATDRRLAEELVDRVDLCLHEAVANIVRHGYDAGATGDVAISLETVGDTLHVTIADEGRPFDPLRHPPAAFAAAIEDAPTGGFGIGLIRTYADALAYRRDGGRNILEIEFRRRPTPEH